MKPSGPIANLGRYAHPPKTNVNFAKPPKGQTESHSPKLITKSAKGKRV